MSMKKLSAIALALTMSVSMLTACGDKEDSSKETTTKETTTTTTTAATTTTTAETTTTTEEAPNEEVPSVESLASVSFNEPFTSEAAPAGATKATIVFRGVGVEGETVAYWNDWCTFKFCVTMPDGTVDWHAVIGSQVGWPTTVDDNGTPDDKEDDKGIEVEECEILWADEDLEVEVDVVEGATITVTALGWNDTEESSACPYFEVVSLEFK